MAGLLAVIDLRSSKAIYNEKRLYEAVGASLRSGGVSMVLFSYIGVKHRAILS